MRANAKTRRAARHVFRLCLVDGHLDADRVRLAARHVAGSGRRGSLPLLTAFERLVRLDQERRTAVVDSATPTQAPVQQAIADRLASVYGPGLDVSFRDDPTLIGGLRIKVGSDVYDGSVRARLAELAARL